MLTASEIGEFAFCPQAWYLRRCGAEGDAAGRRRLAEGARRHRAIGRRTDRLRLVQGLRALLLVLLLLAMLALLVLLSGVVPAWGR